MRIDSELRSRRRSNVDVLEEKAVQAENAKVSSQTVLAHAGRRRPSCKLVWRLETASRTLCDSLSISAQEYQLLIRTTDLQGIPRFPRRSLASSRDHTRKRYWVTSDRKDSASDSSPSCPALEATFSIRCCQPPPWFTRGARA